MFMHWSAARPWQAEKFQDAGSHCLVERKARLSRSRKGVGNLGLDGTIFLLSRNNVNSDIET